MLHKYYFDDHFQRNTAEDVIDAAWRHIGDMGPLLSLRRSDPKGKVLLIRELLAEQNINFEDEPGSLNKNHIPEEWITSEKKKKQEFRTAFRFNLQSLRLSQTWRANRNPIRED